MTTRVARLHAKHDIRLETTEPGKPGPGEVLLAMGAGGICGSDLHYFHDGGFGPVRVKEPIILGHEAAGTVEALGEGVSGLTVGQTVAVNPSRPCGDCEYCREGLPTHCLSMRFSGSAMRFPHEQGLFRERIVVPAAQCVPLGAHTTLGEGACAEPLAVCLHAAKRAGDLKDKRVLVTGAGPIGVLCAAVAASRGAAEIVVTDLQSAPLEVARAMGATRTINVLEEPDAMALYAADKGHFHIAFECSAAAPALASAIAAVRPRGRIVQVGVTGDLSIPINMLVGKEIELVGTQRFDEEFAEAVAAIGSGAIPVAKMVTHAFPLSELGQAFAIAGDRSKAVKVHLRLDRSHG
ncbi:L-idonate 5-dehydrogenase [Fulvimarina sp. 2208YS6-2-32]|uniref:L-idonate 5-dehydrogenase n=1 Tax=Fulvimarina uroteuthidis TaxID=3098149 RepID=A0ABU5I4M0_9HYPH|nr:L-idonate 5-dehydrogenase [Fulvimarina sp. 2208YS6-2-32]MDY8110317.1 L-idonate 5-dehydrogenase [Fulvimarina sp. 2208YS6-2-32]